MDLGFGQMLAVLGGMHGDVDTRIVRARIKYLQRLSFPAPELKVGTGERTRYGLENMLKVVTAFELLAAGVAPLQAAALVGNAWPGMKRTWSLAWTGRGRPGPYMPELLLARVAGLADADGAGGAVAAREFDLRAWMQARKPEDRRITLIEATLVAEALAGAARKGLKPEVESALMAALDDWAAATLEMHQPSFGT
jgi:hypothetical protein